MNKKFYLSNILSYDHIIGGSTSLRKQCPNFRMSDDIDIMMRKSDIESLLSKTSDYHFTFTQSKYSKTYFICSIKFDDGSKIDFIDPMISLDKFNVKVINDTKFLSVYQVCEFKIQLIKNGDNLNFFNKHLKDLIWLNNNGFIKLNLDVLPIQDLPF